MKLLIDTHALVWWWLDSPRLSSRAKSILADRANDVFVSSVCALEIATKVRIGRLPEMAKHVHKYDSLVRQDGFEHLGINQQQALRAGLMKGVHRDPFDRLLAAQSLDEGLVIVTKDRRIAAFGCETLW